MINDHEHIRSCPHYDICPTPLYTGSCAKACFERKAKEDGYNIAYWENRSKHNDYLWAECSNCGFRVEVYKAVKQGRSSTDYERVIYKFCPICGKEMRVH